MRKPFYPAISMALLLFCASLMPSAQASSKKHGADATQAKATPPEEALRAYIARVRAKQAEEVRTPVSIWSSDGPLVRLCTDVKAFRVHDVVMIVVSESLSASTGGQVKNTRASNANSNVTSLFGALKASNALQNLVGASAASGLTAQGQSTTDSSLTIDNSMTQLSAASGAVTNEQMQLTTAQTNLMQADIPSIAIQLSSAETQQTALEDVIAQLESPANSLFSKLQ